MNDPLVLKQFVPSAVCLKCDGCCRFKDAASPWRPRMGAGEKGSLALQITGPFTDDQSYITTIEHCGNQLCQFFNTGDSTCRVYAGRPFECTLYPFILSQSNDGVRVYVHLSCPYVQDNQANDTISQYVAYLKDFFNDPLTRAFLERNKGLLHDYSAFEPELQYLFIIDGLHLK